MAMEPVRLIAGPAIGRRSHGVANMRATVTRLGQWRIGAAALAAGLILAACTSSPSGSASPSATSAVASPATSPASAVCQAAADLRTSVNSLAHVNIGKGTVNEIKSDLADVEAKLAALSTEMHGELKAQTSAVKSALDMLKTAIANLTAHPSPSTIKDAAAALGGFATAASSLLASLAPQCGSASASPSA